MMDFQVSGERAQPVGEPVFHFSYFGNFSGATQSRADLVAVEVNRANFAEVMARLQPTLTVQLELPQVDDQELKIVFSDLKDFSSKGLRRKFPLLGALKALGDAVTTSHEDRPLDVKTLRAEHAGLALVAEMAAAGGSDTKEDETIDLLNMVDIGDDDPDEMPKLRRFFEANHYHGKDRRALLREIDQLRQNLTGQLNKNTDLQRLHGTWRGLRTSLSKLPHSIQVSLIDCAKEDLCDATWSLYVQPEHGDPQPIDLGIYLEPLANKEEDCHILHHLGRMAEHLAVPMLLETDFRLFNLRAWRMLAHAKEVGRTLSGPAHLKWRKERDEPGATWLFPCTNPVVFKAGEDAEQEGVLLPATYAVAAILGSALSIEGSWPAEMLRPDATVDLGEETVVKLSTELADDLAFWGICPLAADANEGVRMLGMTSFANVVHRGADTFHAANLVPYTLSYRFYSGCCARFLQKSQGDLEAFKAFAALRGEDSLEVQEEEGQRILRIKPAFTIFRVKPDFVVGI